MDPLSIPYANDWNPPDNTQAPADVQGAAQTANVLARGAAQTPQDILSAAQPQNQMQSPSVPVQPPPIPSAADSSSKAGFLKSLVTGLLAGAAGGATAPFGSSEGGARGIANYDKVHAQEIADQERAKQDRQQEIENQQRQFQNSLAVNQDQRANQLNQAQIAHTNLQALDLAHSLAVLPLEDQERISKVTDGIAKTYQDRGIQTTEIADTHDAMNAYFKANPDKNASNTLFLPVHSPVDGVEGRVVVVPKDAKGLTMGDLYNVNPTKYKTLKDNSTPISATQFQAQAVGSLNTDAAESFQKGQNEYNQRQENARAAMQRSTQITIEAMKERAEKEKEDAKAAATQTEDPKQLADAAIKGDLTPVQLRTMGKNKAAAVLSELTQRGVDTTAMEREWKFANQPQTQQAILAFNTMDGIPGKDPGVITKWQDAMKEANISTIADLNKLVKKGPSWLGGPSAEKIQKASSLATAVQDQYAKILNGTGASSDSARAQAKEMFDNDWGHFTVDGAVSAARAEVASKKASYVNQSRYLSKPLGYGNQQRDTSASSQQTGPIAVNGKGEKVQWNGQAWAPVQ